MRFAFKMQKQADELVFLVIDAANEGLTPPLTLIEKRSGMKLICYFRLAEASRN